MCCIICIQGDRRGHTSDALRPSSGQRGSKFDGSRKQFKKIPPKKNLHIFSSFFYVSNEKKLYRIGCKHPNVFLSFRFGVTSLFTVFFGSFPRPDNVIFWPKKCVLGTFLKSDIFLKRFILII